MIQNVTPIFFDGIYILQTKIYVWLFRLRKVITGKCNVDLVYKNENIVSADAINAIFKQRILANDVFAYGRPGASEIDPVGWHEQYGTVYNGYPKLIKRTLWKNNGIFPDTDETSSSFVDSYQQFIPALDYIGVYGFSRYEKAFFKKYAANAKLCNSGAANAFDFSDPWTLALKGKKVLVISPFSKTIESQYKDKREHLFVHEVLPEFSLKTVTAVQSLAFNHPEGFRDWCEALDSMQQQIQKEDFDIALIGAGGYSIPLIGFIKNQMGKTAIQMGGTLQILFGIKGARWDNGIVGQELYNHYWVRPALDERIQNMKNVEQGCYW